MLYCRAFISEIRYGNNNRNFCFVYTIEASLGGYEELSALFEQKSTEAAETPVRGVALRMLGMAYWKSITKIHTLPCYTRILNPIQPSGLTPSDTASTFSF